MIEIDVSTVIIADILHAIARLDISTTIFLTHEYAAAAIRNDSNAIFIFNYTPVV